MRLVLILLCFLFLRPTLNGQITWSSEKLVSINKDGGILKSEPSVVMSDSIIIVAWNDSYGGMTGASTGVAIAWAISYDVGETFEFGGYLSEKSNNKFEGADSWLGKDNDGNFYLSVLDAMEKLDFYRMSKNNLGIWNKISTPIKNDLDKPVMHVSEGGEVFISYTDIQNSNMVISTSASKNKGDTWELPVIVSNSSVRSRGFSSITQSGKNVVISWIEGDEMLLDEVWVAYSSDNGSTFSEPILISKWGVSEYIKPRGYSMSFGSTIVLGQTWLTTYKGKSTLVFNEKTMEGASIGITSFDFKKQVWDDIKYVGEKSGLDYYRFFPAVTYLNKYPAVTYYDRRSCDGLDCPETDVYLSLSKEAGFWEDYRVTTIPTDWSTISTDKKYAPIQRNFGDYIFISSDKNQAAIVWTDGRNGRSEIYLRIVSIVE